MKVVCKVNFSWEAIQYQRGFIYEIPMSGKFLDFLKVGYFVEFKDKNELEEKVSETNKKWKELNEEKELKIDKRTKEYKQSLQTK